MSEEAEGRLCPPLAEVLPSELLVKTSLSQDVEEVSSDRLEWTRLRGLGSCMS